MSTSSSSDDNSAVVDDVVDVGGGASTAPLGRRLSLSARTLMGFSDKTAPRRVRSEAGWRVCANRVDQHSSITTESAADG